MINMINKINKKIYSPIIIIGMHRSGTTMITRMLEQLGLFVGNKKEDNNEAIFFFELNDWMLRQSGGNWDNLASVRYLLENQEIRNLVIDYLQIILKSPWFINYLGWKNYLRYRSPHKISIPWGWKDPRNTFLLPIWLDIFPNAKVIHIYRNGVDVANSLKVRAEKELRESVKKHFRRKILYWLYKKKHGFVDSPKVFHLESGIKLWEIYMEKAFSYNSKLGKNALHIKYEDFLLNPLDGLQVLVEFCDLKADTEQLKTVAAQVKTGRAYAFSKNSQLEKLSQNFRVTLSKFGY